MNDEIYQDASTLEMHASPAEVISFVSRCVPLMPGDIISLGAPPGYGVMRDPPCFLQSGDSVRIEISDLGCQQLNILAPPT